MDNVLQFWASTISVVVLDNNRYSDRFRFRLSYFPFGPAEQDSGGFVRIQDYQRVPCGVLFMQFLELQDIRYSQNCELVLLSSYNWSRQPGNVEDRFLFDTYAHEIFRGRYLSTGGNLHLNVMLVRWREGNAERVAVGQVHPTAWEAISHEWKCIRLT
jgi:hypothetical protein